MTTEKRNMSRQARRNVVEFRSSAGEFEIRETANGSGGSALRFTGYACVTDAPYDMEDLFGPYTEVVRSGAFAKTLNDGADVAFVLNHGSETLARTRSGTMTLAEHNGDTSGLHVDAELDPTIPQVQYMRSAIERGDLNEMSFKFRVMRQEWSPDYDQRDIHEVSLNKGDVSLVNYGANPATADLVDLRGRLGPALTGRAYALALTAVRDGNLTDEAVAVLEQLGALVDDDFDLADVLTITAPAEDRTDETVAETGDPFFLLQQRQALRRRRSA